MPAAQAEPAGLQKMAPLRTASAAPTHPTKPRTTSPTMHRRCRDRPPAPWRLEWGRGLERRDLPPTLRGAVWSQRLCLGRTRGGDTGIYRALAVCQGVSSQLF